MKCILILERGDIRKFKGTTKNKTKNQHEITTSTLDGSTRNLQLADIVLTHTGKILKNRTGTTDINKRNKKALGGIIPLMIALCEDSGEA